LAEVEVAAATEPPVYRCSAAVYSSTCEQQRLALFGFPNQLRLSPKTAAPVRLGRRITYDNDSDCQISRQNRSQLGDLPGWAVSQTVKDQAFMPSGLPSSVKKDLEKTCEKVAKDLSKVAPGEKNEKKLAELLSEKVCKDVDEKILTLIAEKIAEEAKKHNPKEPPGTIPKITPVPTLKAPGSGLPSFTIPFPEIDMGGDAKGKFELKVWGDPKDFEKKEKGAMVYFTVKF
jgi:hypothetical protein